MCSRGIGNVMMENLNVGRLTVIGDLLLDRYVAGQVQRISPEAPVPVVLHSACRSVPGGAANVAANAAALGCSVHLVGLLGDDAAAEDLRSALERWPLVETRGVLSCPEWMTVTKTRVLSGRQQIVRIDEERLCPLPEAVEVALIDRAREAIANSDVVICSDYAKGVLSDAVLHAVMTAARERNIPVIVDPKRNSFEAYRGASLITPNRGELCRAAGVTSLQNEAEIRLAAERASAQCGSDVLLTRSEEGMTLWRRDGSLSHASTRKSEVYDVSGAGDTVVAVVAAALSAGQPLDAAMVMATTAAALVVSKLGTATVSRCELADALRRDMAQVSGPVPLRQALAVVEDWRRHGARVVFANGCFDLLHPGHVGLVQAAAREGDRLVIGLNSDASVHRLKGAARPVQDEQARAMVMNALKGVDMVVLFDEDTPQSLIEQIKPDVLVKGADYHEDEVVGSAFVKAYGGRIVLAELMEDRSTTALIRKAKTQADDTHD